MSSVHEAVWIDSENNYSYFTIFVLGRVVFE